MSDVIPSLVTKTLSSSSLPVKSSATTYRLGRISLATFSMNWSTATAGQHQSTHAGARGESLDRRMEEEGGDEEEEEKEEGVEEVEEEDLGRDESDEEEREESEEGCSQLVGVAATCSHGRSGGGERRAKSGDNRKHKVSSCLRNPCIMPSLDFQNKTKVKKKNDIAAGFSNICFHNRNEKTDNKSSSRFFAQFENGQNGLGFGFILKNK